MATGKHAKGWERLSSLILTAALAIPPAPVWAAEPDDSPDPEAGEAAEAGDFTAEPSPFSLPYDPERPRSDILAPAVSFVAPGFDQWWEGQHGAAAGYTGVGVGGLLYASSVAASHARTAQGDDDSGSQENEGEDEDRGFDSKDITGRKISLGLQLYQGAGGFSAYHSFRSSVRSRRPYGQYGFLTREETTWQLLKAPFQFHYLSRSTTLIPLGIGAGLAYLIVASGPGEDQERSSFTRADAFFTAAFSYNAGTHEEAVFRGWMMPVMREYWGSPFWSNMAQSVLFAAAHLGSTPRPVAQLFLGYHFGYVTQKNDWTLGEAIFIHTWWDVIVFAAGYHFRRKLPDGKKERIQPVLWLPPLELTF